MTNIFKTVGHQFPHLETKLKEAGINETPEQFVKKTAIGSFYMSTGILFFVSIILFSFDSFNILLWLLMPLAFFIFFAYFLKLPDVKALAKRRMQNSEVLDATRYLIIELESSIPLYVSIHGVGKNFQHVGPVFSSIISDVNTGTTMEEALSNAAQYSPSEQVRRVLWQILNSMQTGSDIATSLKEMVVQIGREQLVEIRAYGRKLNPIAMFYMIIAVIIPSLGVTMLVVLTSFLDVEIKLLYLLLIAIVLATMQMMFLAVIKSSRPAVHI